MRKPRPRVLEATPVIIDCPAGAVHVTRETWRKAKAKALSIYTTAAMWANLGAMSLCFLRVCAPEAPVGLVVWLAVATFANLAFAIHGWRYGTEKTVQLILAITFPQDNEE